MILLHRPVRKRHVAKGGQIASQLGRRLDKPRLHMVRKTWPGYIALYKSRGGVKVVVKSITKPPKERVFKVQGGNRKFRRIKYKQQLQEVLIVARATKTPAKKSGSSRRKKQEDVEVTDDEIDELESVDELEEDEELEEEDEDLDEDEEEEDDEDEDEPEDEDEDDEDEDEDEDDEEDEEPPKRSKKPRQSRAAADGMVGTNEIAKKAGVDSRTLRMVLRKHKVKKDPETRRYQWKSFNDPTVKKILKWLKAGEAEDIKKESLAKLKEGQEKKRAAKKSAEKKGKGKKRRSRPKDDEDDE